MTSTAASQRPGVLLALDRISLAFGPIRVVQDVGFEIIRHEICALIGPNGAGKSSLLNVINGVYRPAEGTIAFDGTRYAHLSPALAARIGIGRTFQNIALFKGMSVLDNVICGRSLKRHSSWLEQAFGIGRAPEEDAIHHDQAERVIQFLEIQRYRHAVVGTLPYGLQKRVELARALAAEPVLLLLDEPMAGMNAAEKAEMSRFILDINRELGTTIVLIEHDMSVVMDISDHVVVLDYGRRIAYGTPGDVRADPAVVRAYLGSRREARALAETFAAEAAPLEEGR